MTLPPDRPRHSLPDESGGVFRRWLRERQHRRIRKALAKQREQIRAPRR